MNHTPGPWTISERRIGSEYVITAPGAIIGRICNEANARFVVQACNSHEELLDALKTLCAPTIVRPVGFGERYERAEAAIAKAGG
jgi:hypothetical protein